MNIDTEYSADSLIRDEEMKNLWGPDRMPPNVLVDYWRKTLNVWLGEYSKGVLSASHRGDTALDANNVNPGQIVEFSISDLSCGVLTVVLLSRKTGGGDEQPRWLFCPISKYSVPATMWEFYVESPKTGKLVAESWNIGTISEKELLAIASPVDVEDAISSNDVEKVTHAFSRMLNTEFQDIPMMEVGPRIFRTNDPRRTYQRDEKAAYDFLRMLGEEPKEKQAEKAIAATSI